MPQLVAAIAAGILGNLGTDVARDRLRAVMALRASRRPLGEPRASTRRAPQAAPARLTLTPPASYGPAVPAPGPSVAGFVARLARR